MRSAAVAAALLAVAPALVAATPPPLTTAALNGPYTTCANEPVTTLSPSVGGCVYTEIYWRSLPVSQLPLQSITLGTTTLTPNQITEIFERGAGCCQSDQTIDFAYYYIAALENIANGAYLPANVAAALAVVNNTFNNYNIFCNPNLVGPAQKNPEEATKIVHLYNFGQYAGAPSCANEFTPNPLQQMTPCRQNLTVPMTVNPTCTVNTPSPAPTTAVVTPVPTTAATSGPTSAPIVVTNAPTTTATPAATTTSPAPTTTVTPAATTTVTVTPAATTTVTPAATTTVTPAATTTVTPAPTVTRGPAPTPATTTGATSAPTTVPIVNLPPATPAPTTAATTAPNSGGFQTGCNCAPVGAISAFNNTVEQYQCYPNGAYVSSTGATVVPATPCIAQGNNGTAMQCPVQYDAPASHGAGVQDYVCYVYDPFRTEAPWAGSQAAYAQCYNPLEAVCTSTNFLCPVGAPYACGRACFNPAVYQCVVNTANFFNSYLQLQTTSLSGTSCPPSPTGGNGCPTNTPTSMPPTGGYVPPTVTQTPIPTTQVVMTLTPTQTPSPVPSTLAPTSPPTTIVVQTLTPTVTPSATTSTPAATVVTLAPTTVAPSTGAIVITNAPTTVTPAATTTATTQAATFAPTTTATPAATTMATTAAATTVATTAAATTVATTAAATTVATTKPATTAAATTMATTAPATGANVVNITTAPATTAPATATVCPTGSPNPGTTGSLVVENPRGTDMCPAPSNLCTEDSYYYLNATASMFPAQSLTLGTTTYNVTELQYLLARGVTNPFDQSYNYAFQLIPVLENLAMGTKSTPALEEAINYAQAYLAAYPPGSAQAEAGTTGCTQTGSENNQKALYLYNCGYAAGSPGGCPGVTCQSMGDSYAMGVHGGTYQCITPSTSMYKFGKMKKF